MSHFFNLFLGQRCSNNSWTFFGGKGCRGFLSGTWPLITEIKALIIAVLTTFLFHRFQAYKQGFYGKKYVWLLIDWYQPRWWDKHTAHASKLSCKTKHVIEAFGNYISTEFLKVGTSSLDIIGGEVRGIRRPNGIPIICFGSTMRKTLVTFILFLRKPISNGRAELKRSDFIQVLHTMPLSPWP